jgi:hypothetical protein
MKKMFYKALLKAGLHYGDYRSKLLHFEEQKIFFAFLYSPSLEQLSPQCKHCFKHAYFT